MVSGAGVGGGLLWAVVDNSAMSQAPHTSSSSRWVALILGRCKQKSTPPDREPITDQHTDITKVQCEFAGLLTEVWVRGYYAQANESHLSVGDSPGKLGPCTACRQFNRDFLYPVSCLLSEMECFSTEENAHQKRLLCPNNQS